MLTVVLEDKLEQPSGQVEGLAALEEMRSPGQRALDCLLNVEDLELDRSYQVLPESALSLVQPERLHYDCQCLYAVNDSLGQLHALTFSLALLQSHSLHQHFFAVELQQLAYNCNSCSNRSHQH